jgi:hypothetical protein
MKKIILTLIAVTLAIGLYRSFSAASYEAQAAAIQLADTGVDQPADQTGTAQVGANAPTAAKYSSCGGSCNPASCGCSPAQCASGCGGGACGGR